MVRCDNLSSILAFMAFNHSTWPYLNHDTNLIQGVSTENYLEKRFLEDENYLKNCNYVLIDNYMWCKWFIGDNYIQSINTSTLQIYIYQLALFIICEFSIYNEW